ncbi:MAG: SDR family oxidoreductase [Bacteroidales bacterium]|nr:SDR family oxidoreductase [Bacteroidales bacterium]
MEATKNILLIGGCKTELSTSLLSFCQHSGSNLIYIPALGNGFTKQVLQSEFINNVIPVSNLNEEGITECIAKLKEKYNKINTVIFDYTLPNYCSGILEDQELWTEKLKLYLKLLYSFSKRIIGFMSPHKEGKLAVVTESLIQKETQSSLYVEYNTLIGGVNGFTRSLAKELCFYNINVNSVQLGISETSAKEVLAPAYQTELASGDLSLKRFITESETSQALQFLTSDNSGYMHGIEWKLEGGMHLF